MSDRNRLVLAPLVAVLALAGCGEPERTRGVTAGDKDAAKKLGFPATATKNTIRVGGGDAATDAAGVANLTHPATNGSTRPTAVVLVDRGDWQSAVAGAVFAGPPIGAPLLLTDGQDLSEVNKDTLDRLKPRGSDLAKDAQVIRIGSRAARPGGFKVAVIEGRDQFERAAAIDRFHSAARGKPAPNVIVASGEQATWSMPAAAWSARSGDPVLFAKKDSVPEATRKALSRHEKPNIYVLGSEKVLSKKVASTLARLGPVRRIQGPTPVQNAIALARYQHGRFGWGIVVPGYNFTLASTNRPGDAAAAASLATRGVFAPLLLTNRVDELPEPVEAYLLSVQPGYEKDAAGEAVYNRVWILGDEAAISVAQQARLDRVAELIPVQANAP